MKSSLTLRLIVLAVGALAVATIFAALAHALT